jgi:hypothetical protein
VLVVLYHELPLFRDVYRLTLRVHQLTQGFSASFTVLPDGFALEAGR